MNEIAFIPGMQGGTEILIVLFVILLLFGSKKLPELSRSLGRSLGEFKKGKEDLEREIRGAQDDFQKQAAQPEPVAEPKPAADPAPESDPAGEEESTEERKVSEAEIKQ
ncbi:twin-arginine translocase TatA/TatE family subunit [Pontiella sulfatireligans]|uniref:Sec-independent protein translocase protein TatA n=1 Tax=Pontiella sulfatireligans TaxID=2750658 RepID=A0A6C2UGE5_9BACT|nr:twin-arginine translocase TatA/TatE family subunit [Pontiella sulfatireligans]VGO19282.1 Sec-independent protein translocase protein TatA [Pontiella sulfatireligans]